MKNSAAVTMGVVALLVLGGGFFMLAQRPDPASTSQTQEASSVMDTDNKTGDSMEPEQLSSKYVPFSPEVLASASNTRRVLFFFANWCPTCQPADKNFAAKTDQIPEDVTIIRVNYNDSDTDQTEKELAAKYGVTYQHTYVQIDDQGNEVTKWNGGQLDELLNKIR